MSAVERAAEVIARVDSSERGYDTDLVDIVIFRNAAQALADGGLLATTTDPLRDFQWESCGDNRHGQPTGRWVGPIEVGEP